MPIGGFGSLEKSLAGWNFESINVRASSVQAARQAKWATKSPGVSRKPLRSLKGLPHDGAASNGKIYGNRRVLQAAYEREVLRERYRPARVNLLFVGEAPPASGRFFYRADSGLYRAVRSAFIVAFPAIRSADFLESFQALGCYLQDLCERPVDDLDPQRRKRICAEGETGLASRIQFLQPKTMVTVVRSIFNNVERAQKLAGWTGLHVSLPYPGRWRHHQVVFEEAVVPILRRELDGSVIVSRLA
jgi:hypothetical protein